MADFSATASSLSGPTSHDGRQGWLGRRRSINEEYNGGDLETRSRMVTRHRASHDSQSSQGHNDIELSSVRPKNVYDATDTEFQAPLDDPPLYQRRYKSPVPTETATVISRPLGVVDVAAVVFNKMVGAGIYTVPGQVLLSLGDKSLAVLFWACGGIYTLFCLSVYMELGAEFPHNGGELIYLDRTLRPGLLWTLLFASFFIMIANTTGNAIVFAKLVMVAALPESTDIKELDPKIVKLISINIVSIVCLLHFFAPRLGLAFNRLLALYKLCLIITVFSACFWEATHGNYHGLGKGSDQSSTSPLSKISAVVLVLYSYTGWENANYIAGEITKPNTDDGDPKSLPIGAYTAVLTATMGYILVALSYYLAFDYVDISPSGGSDLAMAKNLGKLAFKPDGISLEVLFALSAVGNLVAVVFTSAKVKQTFARERVLPCWEFFQQDLESPKGGLVLHWFFTVVMILATPVGTDGYDFVVGLYTYGQIIVVTFSTLGLLNFLRKKTPWRTRTTVMSQKLVGLTIITLVLCANVFLVIAGAFRDYGEKPSPLHIPGWLWTVIAAGLYGFGALYWTCIYVLQPDVLGTWLGAQVRVYRTGKSDSDRADTSRERPIEIFEAGQSLASVGGEYTTAMDAALREAQEDGTLRRLYLQLDKSPKAVYHFCMRCIAWVDGHLL